MTEKYTLLYIMKIILFLVSIITISLFLGNFMDIKEGLTTVPETLQNDTSIVPETLQNNSQFLMIFYNIFNKSNIIILFWFLAIYYVLFIILNLSQQNDFLSMSKFFDIVVFSIVTLYILITYFFLPTKDQENILQNTGLSYLSYLNDPYSIFSLSLFMIVFYLIIFFLSLNNENKSIVISIIESFVWITFAILIIVDFFKYLLNIPIISILNDLISNIFNKPIPGIQLSATDLSFNPAPKNEVFHISNNIYDYNDAQAVCSSFGATLANYNQLNDYYNQGGEFCSYGWSDNQMALFPTQETTWKNLQGTTSKNVCGRPGINGGVFDPNFKFGVNCFGVKPSPSAQELSSLNQTIPKTPDQVALEEKIQYFKQNPELTNITSFNKTKWSEWV